MPSEKTKQLAFILLVLLTLGLLFYVFFLLPPQDEPSEDGKEFYEKLIQSQKVAILFDARGINSEHAGLIYQCGVDMIYKGRFVGKQLESIACDDSGCISAQLGSNYSIKMTFEQALKKASNSPYILIKPGDVSSYKFFKNHLEIQIAPAANGTCDLVAIVE